MGGEPFSGALRAAWGDRRRCLEPSDPVVQVLYLLQLRKAEVKMDTEGGLPDPSSSLPRARRPAPAASYSLRAAAGRLGLRLLHPLHPRAREPSSGPLSFPGPGARLRSPLGGQPRARVGPGRGLPRGSRRGAGRAGKAVASAASSWLCHGGEAAQPGAFPPGQSASAAQAGGERKGLEQRGCPARLAPRRPLSPACAAGRRSPGASPAGRRPGAGASHVRPRGGRAGEAGCARELAGP